jgi:hypothetical protein
LSTEGLALQCFSFGVEVVQALAERFTIPLQEAEVNCALLQQEWEDMVYYAKEYINLVQDPYRGSFSMLPMPISGQMYLPW